MSEIMKTKSSNSREMEREKIIEEESRSREQDPKVYIPRDKSFWTIDLWRILQTKIKQRQAKQHPIREHLMTEFKLRFYEPPDSPVASPKIEPFICRNPSECLKVSEGRNWVYLHGLICLKHMERIQAELPAEFGTTFDMEIEEMELLEVSNSKTATVGDIDDVLRTKTMNTASISNRTKTDNKVGNRKRPQLLRQGLRLRRERLHAHCRTCQNHETGPLFSKKDSRVLKELRRRKTVRKWTQEPNQNIQRDQESGQNQQEQTHSRNSIELEKPESRREDLIDDKNEEASVEGREIGVKGETYLKYSLNEDGMETKNIVLQDGQIKVEPLPPTSIGCISVPIKQLRKSVEWVVGDEHCRKKCLKSLKTFEKTYKKANTKTNKSVHTVSKGSQVSECIQL